MSDPILLTDAEVNEVAGRLQRDFDLLVKQSQVVAVVELINDVRAGDPVGTVRRSSDTEELAVSCGSRNWWLHDLTCPHAKPKFISTDPVIPSWPIIATNRRPQ